MQATTDRFHQLAQGSIVPLDWSVLMSFTKIRNQTGWFTLDQSTLSGGDLLAPLDNNPTQIWDAYDWVNISDRLLEMNYQRSIEFPYNVQASISDIALNNFDGYLGIEDSPISEYILPSRPLRLMLGFKTETKLPVFVGLTQNMPDYSEDNKIMTWTAIDFLSQIAEQELRETIKMKDVTTDKVIAVILEQYGMTSEQYNLITGNNEIPFVLFKKGQNAGNALRQLVQAENGALWLDEQGILRFNNRKGILGKKPVMLFDSSNTISIKASKTDGIVNRVKIKSDVRVVKKTQSIFVLENKDGYKNSNNQWHIRPGGSLTTWLSMEDPIWQTSNLVFNGNTNNSFFTAKNSSGDKVAGNVTAIGTLFQDDYKLKIVNNNSFPINIDYLKLFGQPAKVNDQIEYEVVNPESQEKFGDKPLEITNNNFFGSYQNCDLFAMDIMNKQSEYNPNIELSVKGDPSLQLDDVISVDGKYAGDYMVTAINIKLSKGLLETIIKAKKHTVVSAFVLDVSKLDHSIDLLA